MKKGNRVLKILVVILFLLVLGLVSYLVYDKVLSNDNIKEENNSNNNIDRNNFFVSTKGYLLDLISESDKNKLDDSKNYKNIEISINGLTFTFNCVGFGGAPGDYCYTTEMLLGSSQVNKSDTVVGDLNTNPYLIITDNYFIIHRTDYQEIEIFDKNGNSLKKLDNVVYSYIQEGDKLYTKKTMYLDGSKLHFYDFLGFNGDPYATRTITLNYIDLLESNYNVVKTNTSFEGKIACFEC